MSFQYPLSNIDEEVESVINYNCLLKPAKDQYNPNPDAIPFYKIDMDEEMAYLPLGQALNFYDSFPNDLIDYPKTNGKFKKSILTVRTDPTGKGRDQDVIVKEAKKTLKEQRTCFLALPTGWGKTMIGVYFCCFLKLKALVLCHVSLVNDQWVEEFEKSSTLKVQRLRGKKIDPKADVYVCGVRKLRSFSREQLAEIGLVIFDEAHICTITAFKESLLLLRPKYAIGMSATPKRVDGMHKVLEMYFGKKKNFIIREEVKNFTVYKYLTPYTPEIFMTIVQNRVVPDWTRIINSIAAMEERWDDIVQITQDHPNDRILILSDRTVQSMGIYNKLVALKEDVDYLIGDKKTWKKDCRILVAGFKKAGVGFNDPTLTLLIMASDTKNPMQYEGRIRTTDNIIYDLVDNYSTFNKHWDLREGWYEKRGATIEIIRHHSLPEISSDQPKKFKDENKVLVEKLTRKI